MRKDDDTSQDELEQIKKDIDNLHKYVKDLRAEIDNLKARQSLRRAGENAPPLTLSDPIRPSPLGKNLGEWYERLADKTRYPIANPEDGQ